MILDICFYSILVLLPALIYPFLFWSYLNNLKRKLYKFKNIFDGNDLLIKYYRHFYNSKVDTVTSLDLNFQEFFRNVYFSKKQYLFPVIILFIVTIIGSCSTLTHLTDNLKIFDSHLSIKSFINKVHNIKIEVLIAFIGAYIWGLYDIIQRMRNNDLTPSSLHHIWLRILVTGSLGFIISQFDFKPGVSYMTSFGIGTFPVATIKEYLMKYVGKTLKMNISREQDYNSFKPLNGISPFLIKRLNEENIYNTSNLAYCDPIILALRTNIEWKVILDVVDQSLFYAYAGDKTPLFRKYGIRGAIEAATIYLEHKEGNTEETQCVIEASARILDTDINSALYLFKTLHEDFFVKFVWSLWETTVSLDREKYISHL